MQQATLCFLIKEDGQKISEICLALKKRGFGVGRWNGVGGKVENETIQEAVIRETREEINVLPKNIYKVAELEFYFPHQPEWNQLVHVYFAKSWQGKPKESEEMKPEWFKTGSLPYSSMWSDDIHWLPEVLNKKLIKAKFVFKPGDKVKEKQIEIINGFDL
jgi:8-oxo-dGTP diphosphatase